MSDSNEHGLKEISKKVGQKNDPYKLLADLEEEMKAKELKIKS